MLFFGKVRALQDDEKKRKLCSKKDNENDLSRHPSRSNSAHSISSASSKSSSSSQIGTSVRFVCAPSLAAAFATSAPAGVDQAASRLDLTPIAVNGSTSSQIRAFEAENGEAQQIGRGGNICAPTQQFKDATMPCLAYGTTRIVVVSENTEAPPNYDSSAWR